MTPIPDERVRHAAELIAQSDAIVVAAGAGMGVDSGLPDFRGPDGFWRAYPALGRARIRFTEIASPQAFRDDPRTAWGFYGHRLGLYRETEPHLGFRIIRSWSDRYGHALFVYTSNVDGQFQKAGYADSAIHECHGSIHWLQCLEPCSDQLWPAGMVTRVDADACRWLGELPSCPRCGGLARPNILMFGDGDWLPRRSQEQGRRLEAGLARCHRPVVIELGAGTRIPSVRLFGQTVIHGYGGRMVRINPHEANPATPFDVALPLGALEGLRAIDAAIAGD